MHAYVQVVFEYERVKGKAPVYKAVNFLAGTDTLQGQRGGQKSQQPQEVTDRTLEGNGRGSVR